jgi:glycosyltransferase involved in cell wall biosynthesis
MKVCLVNSFYPPYIGGAETYVSNLARSLSVMGHEVTVYCGDKPLAPGVSYDGSVRVVRMRTPLTFYGTPVSLFPAAFAAEDYDIVHCNFPNPYFTVVSAAVSRLEKVPAVLTWHNDLPSVTSAASTLVGLNDVASVAYLAPYSKIIATTHVYARSSKILRRERRKVVVIPSGVDTKRFRPDVECEWAKEKYDLEGYKTLIFVGALTTWHTYKGLEDLLRAFGLVRKECEKLKLLIVGGGNLAGYYQRLAQKLGESDRVVFAGRVNDDALPVCYAASDFAVLPSRDSSEGFGLALLESMACGKAVIGSEVGGIPEMVEDWKNGLLVAPNDEQALANAIHALYVDDELRTRMGEVGRRFAEAHDWSIVADRVSSLYEEVR